MLSFPEKPITSKYFESMSAMDSRYLAVLAGIAPPFPNNIVYVKTKK
jgi:hypothetical protein